MKREKTPIQIRRGELGRGGESYSYDSLYNSNPGDRDDEDDHSNKMAKRTAQGTGIPRRRRYQVRDVDG